MSNPSPDPSQVHSVKIFPPIGIARLGDSGFDLDKGVPDGDITYFIPSEIPGVEDAPADGFRDSRNRIKRQAVRFRVYAYDQAGTNLGEITQDETYQLTWTVHVANAKGSFHVFRGIYQDAPVPELLRNPDVQPGLNYDERTKLIVDSGEKHISGNSATAVDLAGKFHGSKETGVDVGLGQLRTDDKGRLVFVPAPGYSRFVADPMKPQPDIMNKFDNIDWVDDTCDGWVNVKIEFVGAVSKNWDAKEKATIISAPPKFAWGMNAPTSLYDLIEDIYWQKGWKRHRKTEFYQDIWPVLRGSYLLSWTNKTAAHGHGPTGFANFLPLEAQLKDPDALGLRINIFRQLRKPNYEDPDQATFRFMPILSGDSGNTITGDIKTFAALTKFQYAHFKKWHEGDFSRDPAPWQDPDEYKRLEDVPLHLQPLFLTRAALEHTIGEPLYPGIEAYWVVKERKTYNIPDDPDESQDPPFRINHDVIKPGHLGRGLSLPWQTDFNLCNTHWWPSIRPDDVLRKVDWRKEKISVEDFREKFGDKQEKWDRIMRRNPEPDPDNPNGPFPFPGLTDMVRFWQRLGFVSKHEGYAVQKGTLEMPVWLEEEDLERPPRQSAV